MRAKIEIAEIESRSKKKIFFSENIFSEISPTKKIKILESINKRAILSPVIKTVRNTMVEITKKE